ncbi:MAG: bifunctional riboflavin kinase/FAD synthetase [Anaerolineales bacterium]|nr:bifunctional riboflavin kinase/FAD synthetase [Anaerolineales bacterium]MDW8277061.1 bifunctional riboflavin kinase/FAD synthetase [Anaerolineales bacterium]
MPHYVSLQAVSLTGSWLTIGVFDGVHRGHQEIIHQLTAGAHAGGAPAVLLTFDPHPAQVLAGRDIPCLTTPEERAELLFALGVDTVITLPFTRELAARTAEDFMAELKTRLGLRKLLIGYDFALGRGRAGNFERLRDIGRELDYDVQAIEAIRFEGEVVSSTLIRQTIAEGDVRRAAAKLGRYYSMQGKVVPGDGRGRLIGIHTANVEVPSGKLLPANGVYAVWVWVEGRRYASVTNIGLRPTFTGGAASPRVEAHLLDFSDDLYGKTLRLEFVERLRGEQKFPSVQTLVAQIQADIERTRGILP